MIKYHRHFDIIGKNIFEKAIIEAPYRLKAEMPNEACFYYIIEGENKIISHSSGQVLSAKEGIVMQCGNYINNYIKQSSTSYCEAIAVHFYPEVLKLIFDKDFADFMEKLDNIKPLGFQRVRSSELLENYINSLQFYFDNPELVSEELLRLKLKELILLLAKTENISAIKELMASLFNPEQIEFKKLIENNVYRNLSLEELAFLCKVSLSTFKRDFKKYYNEPPAKYIKDRKLKRAEGLLKSSSLRISEIAFECGFTDLPHFSKSYHKKYGISPRNYRKNQIDKILN